jgi:hypothetical protein
MNTEKYKSIVVSKELHELVSAMAEDNDRSISKTLERLVEKAVSTEAEEVNLDSDLVKGGTPRIERMIRDLNWFKENSDHSLNKRYVVDTLEKESLEKILEVLIDILEYH